MQYIDILRDGSVTFIKINRPEAMNSITDGMHCDLNTAFDDFSSDKSQLVAVISGEGGKAFCAGSDLKDGINGSYPRGGYAGLINRFDLAKPDIDFAYKKASKFVIPIGMQKFKKMFEENYEG